MKTRSLLSLAALITTLVSRQSAHAPGAPMPRRPEAPHSSPQGPAIRATRWHGPPPHCPQSSLTQAQVSECQNPKDLDLNPFHCLLTVCPCTTDISSQFFSW